MKKFFTIIYNFLKKCFVNESGHIRLKRLLATLLILSYIGISIYNKHFENPSQILSLLLGV